MPLEIGLKTSPQRDEGWSAPDAAPRLAQTNDWLRLQPLVRKGQEIGLWGKIEKRKQVLLARGIPVLSSGEPYRTYERCVGGAGRNSNRRVKVLQTSPLPLGYRAPAAYVSAPAEKSPSHVNAGWDKNLERETGVEPATSTLARSRSTTELLPLVCLFYSSRVGADNSRADQPLLRFPNVPEGCLRPPDTVRAEGRLIGNGSSIPTESVS